MTEAGAAQKEVAPVRLWDIATPVSVMHTVPIGWTTHTMNNPIGTQWPHLDCKMAVFHIFLGEKVVWFSKRVYL